LLIGLKVLIVCTLFSSPVTVQDNRFAHVDREAIDEIFADFEDYLPGCAVGVVDHGELIFSKGYGMANLDYEISITPESRFMIASISKQFAAAALLMMEQEGLLDLDKDLRIHIPELPEFEELITARQIIHHTSGLRDLFDILHLKDLGLDPTTTTENALALLSRQQRLNFRPNTRHMYSNSGYLLISILSENQTASMSTHIKTLPILLFTAVFWITSVSIGRAKDLEFRKL
jgi:CubicO group peptidase (beta-lactamase class C family)